jgi:hypothetical protein
MVLGVDDCLFGALPGFLGGLAASFLSRRYAPTFHPPDLSEPITQQRSDPDAIRKPNDEFTE